MMTTISQMILDALKGQGWLTRKQIAQKIGRDGTLRSNDVANLETLVTNGFIERQEKVAGIARPYFVYRVKE